MLAVEIYNKSIQLPYPDKTKTGSQIRRASQSVRDNIIEGYGRRKYKADLMRFLVFSHTALLEATSQSDFLDAIHENSAWKVISEKFNNLGLKIYNFIQYVAKNWKI